MRERERRQTGRGRDRKLARTEVEGRERLARRVERPVVTREPPPGARTKREDASSESRVGTRSRRASRPARAQPHRQSNPPEGAPLDSSVRPIEPEHEPGDEEDGRRRHLGPNASRAVSRNGRRPR